MRFLTSVLLLIGGLVGVNSRVLEAQQATKVGPGARLRLTLAPAGERLVGDYLRRMGDSVEMRVQGAPGPGQQWVATARILQIEIAQGRREYGGKAALVGGAIGGAAGALFGATAPASCCVPFGWSRGEATALWGGGGLGVGALVGLLVRSRGGDRWVPGMLAPAPPDGRNGSTGVHLGWRIRFGR